MAKKYQAKNFNNRTDLEQAVLADFARTVDKKDAIITGTAVQLNELGLGHNCTIWGVPVVATDYEPKQVKKVKRGEVKSSQLNGIKR